MADELMQARQRRVDLLSLDLQPPDGNGFSLLQQWPAMHARPPVIVLTATATHETEEKARHARATVLRKPIASSDLRAAIVTVCGGRQLPNAAGAFDAKMASLVRDARAEIVKRTAELIELVHSSKPAVDIRYQAHKLAGLAAQFNEPAVAKAADEVVRVCGAGVPTAALAELERTARLLRAGSEGN